MGAQTIPAGVAATITDLSGNDLTADAPASSETFVIDNIQPEMIDGQASGGTGTAGAIKIGDDAVFVVTFDEPVINVEALILQ